MVTRIAHPTRRKKVRMPGIRRRSVVAGSRRASSQPTPGDGSRTYFEVVRSLSADPEVRKAVDETERTQQAVVREKRD